jgi:hypothetical protein
MMQMVDPAEWDLSGMIDRKRAGRLLDPPKGEDLITTVAVQAMEAAVEGRAAWSWQDGREMAGCGRAIISVPLETNTFDALFNGRSGYRAQYYLSCQEGIAFNAWLLSALQTPMRITCGRAPIRLIPSLHRSFDGPYSKLWVHCDGEPFRAAPAGEFKPKLWLKNNPVSLGLRAPLPTIPTIEIKGSWITDVEMEYREDVTYKGDRHCRLAKFGFV